MILTRKQVVHLVVRSGLIFVWLVVLEATQFDPCCLLRLEPGKHNRDREAQLST